MARLGSASGPAVGSAVDGVPRAGRPWSEWSTDGLDRAVGRAIRRACLYTELARRAESEATELLALGTAQERLRAVRREGGGFRNPALVPVLLEGARAGVAARPERSLELAGLALEIAVRLPEQPFGDRFRRDREAEARARLADALRTCGELDRAERALAAAKGCSAGSADLLLLADLAEVAASVACERHRWREGIEHLERAERLLIEGGADDAMLAGLQHRRGALVRSLRAHGGVS